MKTLKNFATIVAMLLCCITANAYSFEVDGIYYNQYYDGSNSVSVTYATSNYISYSGDVVIPETVTYNDVEYRVTMIGYRAFYNCSGLTSVTIPQGMTSIDHYAFQNCSGLTSVTIPQGVTSIGSSAFEGCSGLTSVTIPQGVTTIAQGTFRDCSGLTSVIIPQGVTEIYSSAFYGCSGLTSVTIPQGVTSIAQGTFSGCSGLTSVTIPQGVTSIGSSAFSGCSGLTSVTIPQGVTSIGSDAFTYCSGLTSVNISSIEAWCNIDFENTYSNPSYYAKNIYLNGTLLEELIIPSGINKIKSNTFINWSNITSITIPQGVTEIGRSAFLGCSGLKSVTIPQGVTEIGPSAFGDCSGLTSITIPQGVTEIGSYAFAGCSGLTSATIPLGVTSIGSGAFGDCSALTSIIIPQGVTSISSDTFSGCRGLKSVTIPQGVTEIGNFAFMYCSGLTSINIPQGVTSIGHNAFNDCSGLTSVTIPQGVSSIASRTFYGCSNLTSITIPQGVTSIENEAFSYCSRLTSITIPQGVTEIGRSAFSRCSALTSITIPQEVTKIGSSAFYDCSRLTSVYISSIEDWCNIVFDNNEYANPLSFADCLFLNGTLVTDLEIPNTVTEIKDYAFCGFGNFTSINIPASVASIGESAFNYARCEVNMSPTTPPTLASADAFSADAWFIVPAASYDDYCAAPYWADRKSMITRDDMNVQNVALSAASDKSDLQVTIGDEKLKLVTDLTISGTINSYDFMVMRNKMPLLRHLDLSQATIVHNKYEHYTGYHTEDSIFPGYGLYNCKLHTLALPKNLKGTLGYYSVAQNNNLREIVIPQGVTEIGEYAFDGCSRLTSVTIPQGVTTIGSQAFSHCSGLTSVTIPQGVTSIENWAFKYCRNLTNIILPPTLRNIGYGAFEDCNSLKEIRIPSSVRTIGEYAFVSCDNLKDVYVYVVEPFSISQNTFSKDGNNFIGTLHAPKVSYWDYYYNTQWSQFLSFEEFDEPYDNFYLEGDKVLDENTGSIEGEGDNNPDAEMGDNSGIIVEDDVNQDLGDVDIEHDGENGGSIIVDGTGDVDIENLNFRINVTGGRWYFFCFPFDVRAEDIRCEGGAEWVFRYYDGKERANNGKGGWKNVTSDGNGNFLKAATGYIFQCSKNDVLVLSAKNGKIKKEDKYNELVEHITQNKQDASWNFVGNPYLSYYEVTSEDYSAPITVWDGSKYIAIRPGDDDYQLAPFEAFFVQKPDGKDKVNYKSDNQMTRRQASEAAKAASARRSRQAIDPSRLLVNLTLGNGKDTDRTRVVFNNDAAMEYETACDAAKFSTQGVPQIYTLDAKAVKYAINERPAAQGSVSLGYSVSAKGTYTIAATRMDVAMCLMDNLTGTVHDLTQGGYEFSSEAGTFDKRFTLFVKGDATAIENVRGSVDGASDPIYNVKGQQVEKMEKGDVYIKDNRKVIK